MDLNQSQKQASESFGSVLAIIAGPGTGKTRTLTARLEILVLNKKVNARKILVLTFSRKAANEIKERVGKTSRLEEFPFIGTFHALAHKLLVQNGQKIKVIDEPTRLEVVKNILKDEKLKKAKKKDFLLLISKYKNSLVKKDPQLKSFVNKYNQVLADKGLVDYDDLLILALNLVKEKKLKYDHILIDEFQDTNDLQYQLVKNLISNKRDLFVIGDPRQSIYGFRGGNCQGFKQLGLDFPNCKQIVLVDNYRSGKAIIQVSQRLFPDDKKLIVNCDFDSKVCLVKTFNQYSEADWVLGKINDYIGGIDLNFAQEVDSDLTGDYSFADFAICYRIHSSAKVLESKFLDFGIPYQVIGQDSLYQKKLALFLKYCLQFLKSSDDNWVSCASKLKLVDHTADLIKEKLLLINKNFFLSQIIKAIADSFSLFDFLTKNQLSDLAQFTVAAVGFDKKPQGLALFLNYLDFLKNNDFYDASSDKVTLMTMHAAKGLEFPFVFIAGFEQGLIPYSKAEQKQELEEEKRLLYVALTRAKQEVFLLSCLKRFGKKAKVSEFKKLIAGDGFDNIIDPQIKKIRNKIEKKKRQQLGFFN